VPTARKRPGEQRGGTNEVSATHSNFSEVNCLPEYLPLSLHLTLTEPDTPGTLSEMLVEGDELQEVLMPEGLCARCDEKKPTFWVMFSTSQFGEESTHELGFCGNDCQAAFVQAIPAMDSLPGM
jgi:hypothetical protein